MTQTRRVRQIEFKKMTIARKNADAANGLLRFRSQTWGAVPKSAPAQDVLRYFLFQVWIGASINQGYCVEISPLLFVTFKRFPQRTIESTLPMPGTVCPGVTLQTPFGPSKTAVPLITSRSVQPGIVVGLVSGVGGSFRGSSALTVCCTPVECLLAAVPTGAVDAEG